MLKGIGAFAGIGIGKARKLIEKPIVYEDITPVDPAARKETAGRRSADLLYAK